jgi:aryl-alcohol dehydrogenase-like predicted oxidoreductase
LSGAATPAQLRSNLRSLELWWDEEMESSVRLMVEEPESCWHTCSNLAWN